MRGAMSSCGCGSIAPLLFVERIDYPSFVLGVREYAQHLRDGTVEVFKGWIVIVPSSPASGACDCRSSWSASLLLRLLVVGESLKGTPVTGREKNSRQFSARQRSLIILRLLFWLI